jgi:ribosome maturation factor RimP
MGLIKKPGQKPVPKRLILQEFMRSTPLENKIADIARPAAQDMGLEIVAVKILGEGGGMNVQVLAENPATRNLGVEECTKLSKSLSALLDVEDPINGSYRLEVSSPGIDRPLVRLEDFETYKGFDAKLESDTPTLTGQRKFTGVLQGVNGDSVVIETDQGTAEIPFNNLNKAKLVLNEKLIKQTSKGIN